MAPQVAKVPLVSSLSVVCPSLALVAMASVARLRPALRRRRLRLRFRRPLSRSSPLQVLLPFLPVLCLVLVRLAY